MSTEPQVHPDPYSAPSSPTEAVRETVENLARDANSALNGVADAVGLTERVGKNPYAMTGAALAVGYVIGGGLFTPTTMRLLRLGAKLAAGPLMRERLIQFVEDSVHQIFSGSPEK